MIHPYEVVRDFEEALAKYAGCRYAVAVESCTSAIFLSLMRYKLTGGGMNKINVPKRTYPSVPMQVVHAGGKIEWVDAPWQGRYQLFPSGVFDSAKRFHRGMCKNVTADKLVCVSFHIKKHLPIGRGGAILTDDEEAVKWLRKARFDGREEKALHVEQAWDVLGWNAYMTPEQAARGLLLLSMAKDDYPDQIEEPPFPDCSTFPCFSGHTV